MHPAKSVIFFTTASGAGYGVLILFILMDIAGLIPAGWHVTLISLGVALGLISAGLLSSTAHLGHPERAWRAMSQWRTSWLSREGLFALITFLPVLIYGAGRLVYPDMTTPWQPVVAALSVALALITVYCTAMIYQSLKTIPRWHNGFTVPGYLAMAMATGGLWILPILALSGGELLPAALPTAGFLLRSAAIKWRYWTVTDNAAPTATSGTATGLSNLGTVRLLEGPTTSETYVMREMGYKIGRKHAIKLRRLAGFFGLVIPVAVLAAVLAMPGSGTMAGGLVLIAAISGSIGVVVERWLYFAEAKHVSTLYYGEEFA